MRIGLRKKYPQYWQPTLEAWAELRPHWNPDVTAWSVSQALAFPLFTTVCTRNPTGLALGRLFVPNDANQLTFISDDAIFQDLADQAPVSVFDALSGILDNPEPLASQLAYRLLLQPFPLPPFASFSSLLDNLHVADTPVCQLTTATARRYLDAKDKISRALVWSERSISRLAMPPSDIWHRVWRSPLLPRHRETWYKLLLNALPLGTRIRFFTDQVSCHACPSRTQNLRHFIYDCPLAKQVWSDFRFIFSLPHPVTLRQALYSWSTGGSRYLGREFGYQLQAGHAVALHTLWTAHTQAVYSDIPTSRVAISARFKYLLRRHFSALQSSRHACKLGPLPSFFSSP